MLNWKSVRTRPVWPKVKTRAIEEHTPCWARHGPCYTKNPCTRPLNTPRVLICARWWTNTARASDPYSAEIERTCLLLHGPCIARQTRVRWWTRMPLLHGPSSRPVQPSSYCFLLLCSLTNLCSLPEFKWCFPKTHSLPLLLKTFHPNPWRLSNHSSISASHCSDPQTLHRSHFKDSDR